MKIIKLKKMTFLYNFKKQMTFYKSEKLSNTQLNLNIMYTYKYISNML